METKEIKVFNSDANEVLAIVHELRKQGLVQGTDFDFEYHPSKWDGFSVDEPAHTLFKFYKEKWATWFSLKWS
jgi:hypothetical protein